MENENKEEVELEEESEDNTDWKAETLKLREKAIAQRERTKMLKDQLAKYEEKDSDAPSKKEQKGKLDYGQKAFLIAKGFKDEDFDFVEKQVNESGLALETLLGNKYFKAAYEDRKSASEIQDAMPESSKRSSSASRNSIDYWLKKGGLPPKSSETLKLRRDIVKARVAMEKQSSKFADVSVIG